MFEMRNSILLIPLTLLSFLFSSFSASGREAPPSTWEFVDSDISVDPEFDFGQLPNGMRFIVRQNQTPEGTALVRLHVGAGSLDENENERGLAHFVEHMAFNGSGRIPEGQMIPLLEREGLAFGADTNASTGFEQTMYMLNLPRNSPDLLETALMLMRETASELLIDQDAVERERGIILAERRDRNSFAFKAAIDALKFVNPDARFVNRIPIGVREVLETANAEDLRGFYKRNYVPENTTIVIVGDYPTDLLKERIHHWFADWQGPAPPPSPTTGPIDLDRSAAVDIYLDAALNETVTATTLSRWDERKDNVYNRKNAVLRQVGYRVINRAFLRAARSENAPFISAQFGSSNIFEDARSATLTVRTIDGGWRTGLIAAGEILKSALQNGFSQSDVSEQAVQLRNNLETRLRGANTRSNQSLVYEALNLLENEIIPSSPEENLMLFDSFENEITPSRVHEALLLDVGDFNEPLLRYAGRGVEDLEESALTEAWAATKPLNSQDPSDANNQVFAYVDFGIATSVVEDVVDETLGIRKIRFANGLMLNLKPTDISENQILFRAQIDGGNLLNTKDDPLKTAMASAFPAGGLGSHSQDELTSLFAGRNVSFSFRSANDRFLISGITSPNDIVPQLQLITAALTDPGFRKEGESQYLRGVSQFFANMDATPRQALNNQIGGVLSDYDPRFTLQSQEEYELLTFEKFKSDIMNRLRFGAVELAIVGDFDEELVIDAVAETLGAMPSREFAFTLNPDARIRDFTTRRGRTLISHSGEPDQALIRLVWPTRDDSDLREDAKLSLLARVVRIRLQEVMREKLGQAYSPSARSETSSTWTDYGTFSVNVAVDFSQLDPALNAITDLIGGLAEELSDDLLDRARQPLLESYSNMLKSLSGWMSLTDDAQSRPERLKRYDELPSLLVSISAEEIRNVATRYLSPSDAVEFLVVPSEATKELDLDI